MMIRDKIETEIHTVHSSAVIAADIFKNNFAENPRSHVARERYRQGILEHGGSRDELKMIEDFLGHSPSPQFLLHSLGEV
jgi:metallopeptidase MepB